MSDDSPSIHEFAREGDAAGVLHAIALGTPVDARDPIMHRTPLMEAVKSDLASMDLVRFLIENGADVSAGRRYRRIELRGNRTKLAVGTGNFEKIELLLKAGANIRYQRPFGYDVLNDAVHGWDIRTDARLVPILKLLIEYGAPLDGVSDYSESAIRVLSNQGRFDAVKVLLDAGANAALLEWTPLMTAVALGSLNDVKRELTRGTDLSARDFWSRTPWLLSLQVGDVPKAQWLLAAGANLSDRGRCGKTPLMYPIINGYLHMLRWLLSQGLNPNEADQFGETPLMEAAEAGATECVRILLDSGADLHLVKHSQPAIKVASNLETVRLLVSRGADINEINEEMRAKITRLSVDGAIRASRSEYLAAKHRRFGTSNPEKMNLPFWRAMVSSGAIAYAARERFKDTAVEDGPIWCFRRFGKSLTELPDGRIIEIAGEHEDHYDPDFCIYNDVIVHHGDGTFDIYGYPEECFPPTDFHTATLAGKYIFIIGSLGYCGPQGSTETPVFRLDIDSYVIERIHTTGQGPGWISRHKAVLGENGTIRISFGKISALEKVAEQDKDNSSEYVLDLQTGVWSKSLDKR